MWCGMCRMCIFSAFKMGPTWATSSASLIGHGSLAAWLQAIRYVMSHCAVGFHPAASVCVVCARSSCQLVCSSMYYDGSAGKNRQGTKPMRHSFKACNTRMPERYRPSHVGVMVCTCHYSRNCVVCTGAMSTSLRAPRCQGQRSVWLAATAGRLLARPPLWYLQWPNGGH